MIKSGVILTDLQITYLIELYENDSINDKRIEIPLRFNIKFSTKYYYYCLQTYYLKNGYNKSSNTKRKLKNAVDFSGLPDRGFSFAVP